MESLVEDDRARGGRRTENVGAFFKSAHPRGARIAKRERPRRAREPVGDTQTAALDLDFSRSRAKGRSERTPLRGLTGMALPAG